MRLAIILLAVIIVLSIAATLIPQGQPAEYYVEAYGEALGSFIVYLHLYNFYLTPVFLVPGGLFFLNLLVCSVRRIASRLRNRSPKRFGPDIIHLSLLLIMILGVYSIFTRQEAMVFLAKGDTVQLENGMEIKLVKFDFLTYPDGSPRDWISHIEVFLHGEKYKEHAVEVNKPFAYGPYKVFQNSYRDDALVIAADSSGLETGLRRGDYLSRNDSYLFFNYYSRGADEPLIHFIYKDSLTEKELVLKTGAVWNGYRIEDLLVTSYSGLQIVKMPANELILVTLLLFCAGLALTFYQKLGDKEK